MAWSTASLAMQLMRNLGILEHMCKQIIDICATAVTVLIFTQPYDMKCFKLSFVIFNKFIFPNSQDNVATYLSGGGKNYMYFIKKFMRLPIVKKIKIS